MATVNAEMTLDQWRGMSVAERGRWVWSLQSTEVPPSRDALAALAASDGVTLEEAAELFVWREPVLWRGVGDECVPDPALLARVHRLAAAWREPGTPDTVGEAVRIAGWHYSRGRGREPMSVLSDARKRDEAGCPVRAAEIAAEFVAAALLVWLESDADEG